MSNLNDLKKTVNFINKKNSFGLMHCTNVYPTPALEKVG